MTHTRAEDGTYHIRGKQFNELVGSRVQVWNRTAYKTAGNLTRRHLMRNKWGRIVSAAKHRTAKKNIPAQGRTNDIFNNPGLANLHQ
jgi:hypothetical protein